MSRVVAPAFKCPNFKSAPIEFSFDFGAPFWYRFEVFF
jgi:hypothetical protein